MKLGADRAVLMAGQVLGAYAARMGHDEPGERIEATDRALRGSIWLLRLGRVPEQWIVARASSLLSELVSHGRSRNTAQPGQVVGRTPGSRRVSGILCPS